jgi:hypothetical protein
MQNGELGNYAISTKPTQAAPYSPRCVCFEHYHRLRAGTEAFAGGYLYCSGGERVAGFSAAAMLRFLSLPDDRIRQSEKFRQLHPKPSQDP